MPVDTKKNKKRKIKKKGKGFFSAISRVPVEKGFFSAISRVPVVKDSIPPPPTVRKTRAQPRSFQESKILAQEKLAMRNTSRYVVSEVKSDYPSSKKPTAVAHVRQGLRDSMNAATRESKLKHQKAGKNKKTKKR